MKIAFVYDTIYPWITGGAEHRIYEIASRLVKYGHEVHIFSLGFWKLDKKYENMDNLVYNGISLHSVGDPMELYIDGKRSIKEAIYFALKVLTTNSFRDFDIIDCQGFPYFSSFSSFFKIIGSNTKLILTLHEVWDDYWYTYMGKLGVFGKYIEKTMFYLSNNMICVSNLTYNGLIKTRKPDNVKVIANGVDINSINNVLESDEHCNILFAGRLIKEKNIDLLVNSIDILRNDYHNVSCFIVGSGPEEDHLKKLVKDKNLENNILFKGFLDSTDDLYSLMKNADVFVLPSIREGFGMVVIEANSCGLPVVVVNSAWNASCELVSKDNGWVIENNVDSLVSCLLEVLDSNSLDKLKESCKNKAKDYDWDNITLKIENFYKECL
ncbi:MAG: glycosyltransferase family 4 protein [Methanobacteriaceae archaeon]|nr:glycosyltransferase family 4 protein [Methanobacteriaceae archaeon]